jgi:hypothetical protein
MEKEERERERGKKKEGPTLVICREMSGPYTVFSAELKNHIQYGSHLKL